MWVKHLAVVKVTTRREGREMARKRGRKSAARLNQREKGAESPPLYGVVLEQMVRCGKSACRCMNGGPAHGPFFYRLWRDEEGRLRKAYVRKAEVESVRARCAQSKQNLAVIQQIRREIERDMPLLRRRNQVLRGLEQARREGIRLELPGREHRAGTDALDYRDWWTGDEDDDTRDE
jgi:hypothetical protein